MEGCQRSVGRWGFSRQTERVSVARLRIGSDRKAGSCNQLGPRGQTHGNRYAQTSVLAAGVERIEAGTVVAPSTGGCGRAASSRSLGQADRSRIEHVGAHGPNTPVPTVLPLQRRGPLRADRAHLCLFPGEVSRLRLPSGPMTGAATPRAIRFFARIAS